MIYQYAYNITDLTNPKALYDLYELLSDERKARIRRYRFSRDKLRCMFAEIILRYGLLERYGIKDITMEVNRYGKPFLAYNKGIYFNLSHSGDWVLCGIGDEMLGIDVERIEDMDLSIANNIFAKEECDYLFALNKEERIKVFYQMWTLKESYTKNIGVGLNIPLKSFMFKFEEQNITLYKDGKRDRDYSFKIRSLDEHHSMALCVTGKAHCMPQENFTILTLEEIMRWKNQSI